MHVTIEFFGIPRQRSGRAQWQLELSPNATDTTLRTVLQHLAQDLPAFAAECLTDGELNPGLTANLNGQRFTRDNNAKLADGTTILIMSADAGG